MRDPLRERRSRSLVHPKTLSITTSKRRGGGERSSRPTPCCRRTSFFPSSDYESTSKQAKAAIDCQNDSDSRSSDSAALPMS